MISLTSPVDIWAHRIWAGPKLVALCLSTVGLFIMTQPLPHLAALFGVLGLYASGGAVFLKAGIGRLRPLWLFLAIVGAWHLFTGALSEGLVVILRLVTAVALANFVTMTTTLSDMMGVLRKLFAPVRRFGFSTHPLEIGVAMVIRFTPVLAEKGTHLSQSWRARSPKKPNWRIVMPFTVLAIDDAEHVAEALKARGGLIPPERT